jgi:ABC-type nitrate/sulfonate/bicarbonate transport system substrate-binding protein
MTHWTALRIRSLLALGVAWAFGCALAAPLNLAVSNGPVSLLVYAAEGQGFFKHEGLSLNLVECSSGRNCLKLLTDGTVDLATAADVVVALNSFTRPDLAVLGTVSASSHQIKLIARRSAGIATPEQVRGKRLATVQGTSAQYFLDSWLLFHGIESRMVQHVYLPPDELGLVLQLKDVDAVAIWEPLASQAMKLLGDDALALPNPRVYTQHFNLISTRSTIAARRTDLVKVLHALARAHQFIREQPDAAAQLLARRLGIDTATATAQMKEQDYRLRLDQSLVSTLSSQLRWAVREGHAKPDAELPNPLRLIEATLLREAAPSAVDAIK